MSYLAKYLIFLRKKVLNPENQQTNSSPTMSKKLKKKRGAIKKKLTKILKEIWPGFLRNVIIKLSQLRRN